MVKYGIHYSTGMGASKINFTNIEDFNITCEHLVLNIILGVFEKPYPRHTNSARRHRRFPTIQNERQGGGEGLVGVPS
jgi:hypothetical protein